MMKFNEERTLPNITVSVLVISGEHDRLTLQSASERMASLLPDARPFCNHAGHLGHWEQNESVSGSILDFADKAFEHPPKNNAQRFSSPGSVAIRI